MKLIVQFARLLSGKFFTHLSDISFFTKQWSTSTIMNFLNKWRYTYMYSLAASQSWVTMLKLLPSQGSEAEELAKKPELTSTLQTLVSLRSRLYQWSASPLNNPDTNKKSELLVPAPRYPSWELLRVWMKPNKAWTMHNPPREEHCACILRSLRSV